MCSRFFSYAQIGLQIFFQLLVACIYAEGVAVTDSMKKLIFLIQNDKIISVVNGSVIYTVKGNLVFTGDSEQRADIVFMFSSSDIFSRKGGQLLLMKNQQALFTVLRGKIYLGAAGYRDELLLGEIRKTDSSMVFMNPRNERPVFQIHSSHVSPAKVMAIVRLFFLMYNMEQAILDSLSARAQQHPFPQGAGTIRRLWSATGKEDFVWDGRILRHRWHFNDFEHWWFDGQTLRRAYYQTNEDFEWDGHTLRRKWLNDSAHFVVEGNTIRRVFGDLQDEFHIQGNIIKRAFSTYGADEWEVAGEVPIPIIILVIYRIAR